MDDPLAHLLDAGLDLSRDHRYLVERELGRGSMGIVYESRDLLLDRKVAIKVMAGTVAGEAEFRRHFEREARAAARLAHRNVVTIHDFGCDFRGAPFVVMELLRGRDLRQALAAGRPLSLDRRLAIVLQVLAGLAHAHASGVVHRDVKPANVFITEDGVVKLLDFGIARLCRTGAAGSSDAAMGTADYMSPEQVLGGAVDGRSDIFSCGALLFELLAGRPPFHAESFVTVAYRAVHEQPDYASLPSSCRALEPVLRKALAKSRDERHGSAPDLATDIGLAMGVGVAPETIQPAPAWTMPLPRLAPVRPPAPTVAAQRGREAGALRPPELSPVRPRWPLRAPEGDENAAPRAKRGRRRHAPLAMAAAGIAAALAFAVGMSRREAASPPVPAALGADVPAVAPPEARPLEVARPPAESGPLPASEAPSTGSLWTVVASRPSETPAAAPSPAALPPALHEEPPRIVSGRWTGYLTDDLCREKGAVDDHGRCLEICLRRGRQALISIDGRLYTLIGIDRIRGLNDRRVMVEGRIDLERRALTVSSGWPAR